MNHDLTDYLLYALAAALVFFIVVSGSVAYAGMIDTEQAVAHEQAGREREQVKTLLERQDVAKQMQAMGVSPKDVRSRVDAMTDREVHILAGKLNSLPAAGVTLSNNEMIIIGLLVVILIIVL